jgi:peptidyl-tRNA hydrolase
MDIKVLYRKNLKMSEGKIASQVAHAVKNLGITPLDCNIIVLKVSDKKFFETIEQIRNEYNFYYIQYDKGLTEVEPNTPTAVAWTKIITTDMIWN